MSNHQFTQPIRQLEKRRGGYFYLVVEAATVDQLPRKKATRLVCILEQTYSFSCGLNHLGDGNFFLIIAKKYLDKLGKELGDPISFEIKEDPNPLGVEIPEALQALLEQDTDAKEIFEKITDGKKRSLIYSINKLKDIDKQIQKSIQFLEIESLKLKKKKG
ncbi:MAG: YdeI/OmpD-associated family protein [Bacteroidota bacterium]